MIEILELSLDSSNYVNEIQKDFIQPRTYAAACVNRSRRTF